MPKKLSSAVVGTLAVGLTMPLTANAAAADTAPMNVAALSTAGVDAPATGLTGLSSVDVSASQNATQFRLPLAQRTFSYTSPYGSRCMPTQGASTSHLGQDLGAADGSPIYSVAAGTVVRAFSGNRYNTGFVVVQHQIDGRTFHSAYLHMWDAHTHVRVGQTVQAGQTISRVGSSGPSTGPHLHLEIWEGAWMHGTSHNPTTWLAQRGVDLRASASTVMNITNPSACNYWTVNSTPLRATASSTGSVIMQLGAGATLTAAPGDTSNGMVRVNANGRIGWVAHSSLTPSRPAGGGTVPAANVPQGTSITPTQYRTTAALNGRSGPGSNYAVLQGLTSGTTVTVTATHGGWMKFSRNGQSVWSHGDFLSRVSTASTDSSNTSSASTGDLAHGVSPASGSYKVKAGVNLVARSNASGSSPMVKVLKPGTTVTLTGMKDTKVRFHDGTQNLWVTAAHLERVTASTNTAASTGDLAHGVSPASGSYKVKAGVNLVARSNASGSSPMVKVLKPGTTVTLTGMKDTKVRFHDGTQNLWVTAAHLERVTASTNTAASTGDLAHGVSPASGSYKVKAGVNLVARSNASGSSPMVKVLKPGTTVTLTGMKDTKVRFHDGTQNLWVTAAHLERVTASTNTAASTGDSAHGVSPASGSYKVKAGVNLVARSNASGSSPMVKVLKPGTTVTLTGMKDTKVRFHDGTQNLWVTAAHLERVTASTTGSSGSTSTGSSNTFSYAYGVSPASGTYTVKAGVNLNARTTASTTSSIAKVLKPGTTIEVNGEKGSWVRFHDGTRNLWVSAAYLDEVNLGMGSGSETIPGGPDSSSSGSLAFGVSPASGSYTVKAGVNLNARTTASTTSSIAKVLKPGTTIEVNGEKGSAVRFHDGTRNLWVSVAYLEKVTTSSDSSSSTSTESPSSGSLAFGVSPASGSYTVKAGVNLNARTTASTTSSIAKVLKPGTTIEVNGEKGSAVRFHDGTRNLWVSVAYLEKVSTSSDSSSSTSTESPNSGSLAFGVSPASGSYTVKAGVNLNARTTASTTSSIAKVLKPGTTIEVNGEKGSAVRFHDGTRNLWVSVAYLEKVSTSSDSSSSTSTESPSSTSSDSSSAPTAASGSYTVKSGIHLNARTGASATSSSVKVLSPGTKISITGKMGEWVSFQDGTRTLWVHSDFLTPVPSSSPSDSTTGSSSSTNTESSSNTSGSSTSGSSTSASGTHHVKPNVYLNARSGPGTSHQVVLNLNPLRQFEITGRSGGWVSFVFSGQTVWVDSTYINAGAAGSSGSSSTGSSSTGSSSSTPTLANSTNSTSKVVGTATTTAQVNVRMGPSTENSTMFSVPTGTRVELLEKKTTGWQEVKVNGATGWMSAQFLTTSDTATSGSGSTTGGSTTGSSGSGTSTSGSGSTTGGSTTGSSGSGTSTAPSTSNMHTKSSNGPYSSAWDKLAQCESGGNWKINTGNGFYGGIQFSPESWKEVGGSGFPHQATREEQIKRAHMLWKKQGWNAWPHCTSQLGLKGDPGGYGDDYYKVHPSAKTVSSVSAAGTWTASYSVPLREEASTSSDKLVQVPRGTELKQLQREGSWLKVQYKVGGDNYTGWVNTSYISQA